MRSLLIFIIFIYSLLDFSNVLAVPDSNLTLYTNQKAAQRHCPSDEVVWLNTKTGIWHSQGGRWYGNTKSGAYVCAKEATAAGDRASLNG